MLVRSALGALGVLVAVMASAAADPDVAGRASVPRDATLVLRLSEQPGEAPGDERHVLEIWGDGRIRVQRPSYMKGSREAETHLAPGELDAVVAMLAANGVLDFDTDAVRARATHARTARLEQALRDPTVTILDATDPDSTSIEIRFDRTGQEVPGSVLPPAVRRIEWLGLRADARFFPECPELAALAQAQAALWHLAERAELK